METRDNICEQKQQSTPVSKLSLQPGSCGAVSFQVAVKTKSFISLKIAKITDISFK